jgi:hypothetical protein
MRPTASIWAWKNARWQVRQEGYDMAPSTAARARKRRDALRAAGLRAVQIWIPDTRRPGFAEEARRQSRIAAASDLADADLLTFMDAALTQVGS